MVSPCPPEFHFPSDTKKETDLSLPQGYGLLVYLHFFILFSQFRSRGATLKHKRALSQDVTVAMLVFQNIETTAILVSQSNPAIVVFFPTGKAFLCFNTEFT